MPLIFSSQGQQKSPSSDIPISTGTGQQDQTANIGKINLDITRPSESLGQSATGLAAGVQAIGKGVVNVAENLPVVGMVTKPIIGGIGAIADATIGKAVGAVADSPVGKGINDIAGAAVGVAFAPIDGALKLLTIPVQEVGKRVAAARLENTLQRRQDLVSFVFGNAPESAASLVRNGMTIEEVADKMATEFGTGPQEMGAFSSNGFANLAYNILLDPLTYFGGALLKPFTIGRVALALGERGVSGLRIAAEIATKEAEQFAVAGLKREAKQRLAQAAEMTSHANFIEKYPLVSSVFAETFGKVRNPLSSLVGGGVSKQLAQGYYRVANSVKVAPLLDKIEGVVGKDLVDRAVSNTALTLTYASRVATADVAVNARRGIFEKGAEEFAHLIYTALGEGQTVQAIADMAVGDTGVTVKKFLTSYGMSEADALQAITKMSERFIPEASQFYSQDAVKAVIGTFGDVFSKADVRANPDLYLQMGNFLGQSNPKFGVDAAVTLLNTAKMELKRFADNPEIGMQYLSRLIQHGFEVSAQEADRIAAATFSELASDPRGVLDVLEFTRAASFGKSMRVVADIRAGFPKSVAEIPATIARRDNIAKTFFGTLVPEEAAAAAAVVDSIVVTAANKSGMTIDEYYAKKVFGLSGDIVDDAAALSDELFSTQREAKVLFENLNAEQVLERAKTIVPTDRMKAAGLGGQLKVEVVDFGEDVPFALPGGLAALDDPAPYNYIDEVIIQAQGMKNIPGDVRVKMYKKIWAGKAANMQDPIQVVNRVMFASLSANTGLIPNAALYSMLRVRSAQDLAEFAAKWGELARTQSARDLGNAFKAEMFGAGPKRIATSQAGVSASLTIDEEVIGRAMKIMVYANENPSWFTLRQGETMEQLANRLTGISGIRQKVGTFAAELMNPGAMSRGAYDRHMVRMVMDFAEANGLRSALDADIRAAKGGDAFLKSVAEKIGSASDGTFNRGVKGWAAGTDAATAAAVDELPDWLAGKTRSVAVFEGSVAEVFSKWVDRIAAARAAEFPGIESLSGAQKQWFLWDVQRGEVSPHSWVNTGIERMEKATAQQIADGVATMSAAGFQRPDVISEFFAKNGKKVLGVTQFTKDGQATIKLFQGSDITTAIHEIGHFARRQLDNPSHKVLESVYGIQGGKWTKQAEERFANDFVLYLRSGKSPVRDLDGVFSKIREFISNVWASVSGDAKVKIDPELRKVFDSLFISNGSAAAEPTADLWSRVSLISTRNLTQTTREQYLQRVENLIGNGDGSNAVLAVEDAVAPMEQVVDAGRAIIKNDGSTFNPIRGTSRTLGDGPGIAIAVAGPAPLEGAARELILSNPEEQKRFLRKLMGDYYELLKQDGYYIGTYDTGEKLFVEISKVHQNIDEAIAAGVKRGEESLFSFHPNAKAYDGLLFLDTEAGRAAAASKGKSVIRKASDIPNFEGLVRPKMSPAEQSAAVKEIADELIMKYDDVARVFYGKGADPMDVISFVQDHPEIMVRELSAAEQRFLPQSFRDALPQLEAAGYRYGIAPQNGVLERSATVVDRFGRSRLTQVVSPYSDILDNTAINEVDRLIAPVGKRPTTMDRIVDKLTRPYGPEVIRQNYVERLTFDLMRKAKLSQNDVLKIVNRVGNLAATKETTVKGLWFERDQVNEIFKSVMGEVEYYKYIENNDPLQDIVTAAAGDFGVIGLAPGVSGRAKAWKPQMGVITDRAVPQARFGRLNPIFYNWLEPIETKTMKFVHDIRGEVSEEILGEPQAQVLQRMFVDNRSVGRELSEGLFYDQGKMVQATTVANAEAPGLRNQIAKVIGEKKLIKDLKFALLSPMEYKINALGMTANELALRDFDQRMLELAPDSWQALKEWGMGDARTTMAKMLEDYQIQSNPVAMARALEDGMPESVGLWTRALTESGLDPAKARELAGAAYGVFQDSMIRATKTAERYQFFGNERSWFERSINHPFLGIYPYSYMTQKAIPAMLKLLFAPRIAGKIRPGLGYVNYMRIREYIANDLSTSNDFWGGLSKDRSLWYAVNLMLPATPENMGFSAPSYFRRGFLQPAATGQPIDLNQLSKIPTYVGDSIIRGTFLGQSSALLQAGQQLGTSAEDQLQQFSAGAQQELNKFFLP